MPGKIWFIQWFWLFNKQPNIFILREICERTRCPSIVILTLLLFIGWILLQIRRDAFFFFFVQINLATSPKLYRSHYLHRSRDSLSPVCGIFGVESKYPAINIIPNGSHFLTTVFSAFIDPTIHLFLYGHSSIPLSKFSTCLCWVISAKLPAVFYALLSLLSSSASISGWAPGLG